MGLILEKSQNPIKTAQNQCTIRFGAFQVFISQSSALVLRLGLPSRSVIDELTTHLGNPDPETQDILTIPTLLSTLLSLHGTFSFRPNATQAFHAVLNAVLMHHLYHASRRGEEGAAVARLLLAGTPIPASSGHLIYSDADHPALQHVASVAWPTQKFPEQQTTSIVRINRLITASGDDDRRC